jgi:ketosteroid isomerase-like protein
MSEENADRIRRAFEVWNESGPAAVTERFWGEDAVYREGPGWPEGGVFRGRAAALARMQALIDLVGPIKVRLDELIDVGDGRIVACARMVGRARRASPRGPWRDGPPGTGAGTLGANRTFSREFAS